MHPLNSVSVTCFTKSARMNRLRCWSLTLACMTTVTGGTRCPAFAQRVMTRRHGGVARRKPCDMCASPNNARAGPTTPAPVYDDSGLLNATLMKMFRSAVVSELGGPDSIVPGADGLWELVHRLNARGQLPAETQDAGLAVLRSLFPRIFSPMHGFAWKPLPVAFRELFSRPLPGFASKLNALR